MRSRFHCRTLALPRRLAACSRGGALVEFGLVAPLLALIVLGVVEGGAMLSKYNGMHTGLSGGANYVMSGGSDLATVRLVALSAWPGRGSQASVSASKVCRCGEAGADCSLLCADQTAPRAFITITAADVFNDGVSNHSVSARQEVRVR